MPEDQGLPKISACPRFHAYFSGIAEKRKRTNEVGHFQQ
jgi:hypothetical protein